MTSSFDRRQRVWIAVFACVIAAGCLVKTPAVPAQKPPGQAAVLAELTSRARALIGEKNDQQALAVLERILEIDPNNEYAKGVRPLVADRLALSRVSSAGAAAANPMALQIKLPPVKFDAVQLRDAMDFLRDVTGANIQVNWPGFKRRGIHPDTPVNARFKDQTLEQRLREMFAGVGAQNAAIRYIEDNAAITISMN
jgi:hypothetical protein